MDLIYLLWSNCSTLETTGAVKVFPDEEVDKGGTVVWKLPVLYTHQKTKKAKTWQDGTLKVLGTGTKAVLYDDKGSKLDVLHIHSSDVVTGEQLESDRYYIQVEELQKKSPPQGTNTPVTSSQFPQISHKATQLKEDDPQAHEACTKQNAGLQNEGSKLKRKRGGFIPPRVVRPRIAENEVSSPNNTQAAVSSAFTVKRGPSSHPFCAISSVRNENPSEKLSPSALLFGGRTTAQASADTPLDSLMSSGSPLHRSHACGITKSSPWRTIGSSLSRNSPVSQNLSSGQTLQMDGREQTAGKDLHSPSSLDKSERMFNSPNFSASPDFLKKTQVPPKSLSGNAVQSELNLSLGKRSKSDIMALLGKKKLDANLVRPASTCSNTENSAPCQDLNKHKETTDQKSLVLGMCGQSTSVCINHDDRLEEMESPNAPTNAYLQNMLRNNTPNGGHQDESLKASPSCLAVGIRGKSVGGTETFTRYPSTASPSSESAISPKLSASTLSLSKHDFEEAECIEDEGVSSQSTAIMCADTSDNKYSQTLSDFDFCQSDHETDFNNEKSEGGLDCALDRNETNDGHEEPVEVTQEQRSNLNDTRGTMNCTVAPDSLLDDNGSLSTERWSQSGGSLELNLEPVLTNSENTHCSEIATNDVNACFEMSFSPLSEVGDNDEETSSEHGGEGSLCKLVPNPQISMDSDGQAINDAHNIVTLTPAIPFSVCNSPQKDFPIDRVSQSSENTLNTMDKVCIGPFSHPVDSVVTREETDVENFEANDPGVVEQHEDGVNASEMKTCNGNALELQTSTNIHVSKSEKMQISQPLSMGQNRFPGTLTTYTENMKSQDISGSGISSNMPDWLRTVNDLELSPDSFVPPQSCHLSPETAAGTFRPTKQLCQGDNENQLNGKDTFLSCDTLHNDGRSPHLSQSQNGIRRQKPGIMTESYEKQIDVDGGVSSNHFCGSFTVDANELLKPSPTLSVITVSSCDTQPVLSTTVQHSSPNSGDDSVTALHCSAKAENEFPGNKSAQAVSPHSLRQSPSSPQDMTYSSSMDLPQFEQESPVPAACSLPVHRLFQTVSEVLNEKETSAQAATFHSFCKTDPVEMLKNYMAVDKSVAGTLMGSLTSADFESRDGVDQPSKVPPPDGVVRAAAFEHCPATTATNIAEAISARLTNYKMQGMVASDMVQRPMAYRRETGDHHTTLPWISTALPLLTHATGRVGSERMLDLFPDSVPSNSREAVDQNLSARKNGFHSKVSPSAWTFDSQLFSPSGTVDMDHQGLEHLSAVQYGVARVCQAKEKKKDDLGMNNGADEERKGSIYVDDDVQTASNEAALAIPTVKEDSLTSPVLFSQCDQSQRSAVPFSWTQRSRKLIPVVTAPDEVAAEERLQLGMDSEDKDRTASKTTNFMHEIATPSKQNIEILPRILPSIPDAFPLRTDSSDSLTAFYDVIPPAQCRKEVGDNLTHTSVENFDLSGFTDSFPESNQGGGDMVCAERMTTLGDYMPRLKGETNSVNAEVGEEQKDMAADLTSVVHFGGSVCRKTDVQKTRQSSRSSSTVSSPGFVIANTGLDGSEELEDDSAAAMEHKGQPEVFLSEQDNNSVDSTQRQKKAKKFALQFQTLQASIHSPGKENLSRNNGKISIHGLRADSEDLMTDDIDYEPECHNFQKTFGGVTASGHKVLVPSAPTGSPPLDMSPDRTVEMSAGLDTKRNQGQCKQFRQPSSSSQCSAKLSCISSNDTLKRCPPSHTRLENSKLRKRGFDQIKSMEQTMWTHSEASCPPSGGSSVSLSVSKETVMTNVPTSRRVGLGKFKKPGAPTVNGCLPQSQFQSSLCHELQFCSREEVESQATPVRQVAIPPSFESVVSYKQILTAALTEFINIQLFTVAKTYHCALSKVDLSACIEGAGAKGRLGGGSNNPACKCGSASKVAQVKKEGPNKGRFFYACSAPRDRQCKFFQWVDQQSGNSTSRGGGSGASVTRPKFSDPASIMGYFRNQGLAVYCQCQFIRRLNDRSFTSYFPKWVKPRQSDSVQKKTMYIKLPKKDSATAHAKDDLWVISRSLNFAKGETFVARSSFHGPNTQGEVAVDPVAGYSASLWSDGNMCHAIHCGNAATELTCMANIQDHVDMTSLPLLPHLLSYQSHSRMSSRVSSKGFKAPTAGQGPGKLHIPSQFVHDLASDFICKYQLNSHQAQAVRQAASMMDKDADPPASILLIHGVFGAGKSFLLSVVILFLVEVFQRNDSYSPGVPFPWKLLLSSTTNVAVDRVLQGLLELGFDDFVRVGSVKKIAKPVLPYSMHASGSESQELKDLQEMLKSQDVTSAEKHCIRKSIERHRLGENRKKLGAVRVVGVTCAACSFQCLDKMQFPFVVLDECSQMTEPASLLPIARSSCEKLLLVGDPKQLDPTLQGSDAAHAEGLEQTLFDRLMKMGNDPVMLRTQYRCHPTISAVSNALFYNGQLLDGVSPHHRQPILDFLPTMCFYDISSGQETTDSSGSFSNEAEAQFVALLLSVLMVHGLQPAAVGVITLYKAQARRILDIIRHSKRDAQREMTGVQVSTVDAFQGAERDIIILSCVRTHSVGFIDSDKRMNVALTRARHHMLIVGHQRNLYGNKRWTQVISHCQALPHGVVSSSTARRQLQAVLDQANENQPNSIPEDPPRTSHQAQESATRKRKPATQKGAEKGGAVMDTPLPSVVKPFTAASPRDSLSSDHLETPQAETGEENTTAGNGVSDGSSPEMKYRRSAAGHRVKPLVIEEDEADQLSDDDFLPDGLL